MFLTGTDTTIRTCAAALMLPLLLALPALPGNAMEDPSQAGLVARLKADYKVLRQAEAEFRSLRSLGNASPGEIADYQLHLAQLRKQLAQGCQALSRTNQASLPKELPCPVRFAPQVGAANIDITAEQTTPEAIAELDAELSASLGAFDENLLREQNRVKSNKPATDEPDNRQTSAQQETDSQERQSTMADGESGELAELENPLEKGEKTAQSGEGEAGSAANQSQQAGQETTATDGDETGTTDADIVATTANAGTQGQDGRGQSRSEPSGKSSSIPAHQTPGAAMPENLPDGSDDDIVARQLREAAEKETDPELKKRLWEEYRKYKRGG